MKTENQDTNIPNLKLSIENNYGKLEVMPPSACNHIYNKLPKEEKPGGVVVKQRDEGEDVEFEDPEEYEDA